MTKQSGSANRNRDSRRDSGNRRAGGQLGSDQKGPILLYGLHTVRSALNNPARRNIRLLASRNALQRLDVPGSLLANLEVLEADPRALDKMLGKDAVHQGIVLEADRLIPRPLDELSDTDLVLVLDQISDPHNLGAILRSAVALGAGAVITTSRHSAGETGVLAKSASGALDMIDLIEVRNLTHAFEELHFLQFQTVGLDSEGTEPIEKALSGDKIALVMGAEGRGLRQKTRQNCTTLARIDMPGKIKSLNVSNAAVLALYVARQHLLSRV